MWRYILFVNIQVFILPNIYCISKSSHLVNKCAFCDFCADCDFTDCTLSHYSQFSHSIFFSLEWVKNELLSSAYLRLIFGLSSAKLPSKILAVKRPLAVSAVFAVFENLQNRKNRNNCTLSVQPNSINIEDKNHSIFERTLSFCEHRSNQWPMP